METDEKNTLKKKSGFGFGDIFEGIRKIVMEDEYLQQTHDEHVSDEKETPPVTGPAIAKPSTPVAPATSVQSQASAIPIVGSVVDKTIEKIYHGLEALNQPGIDFLEVWNAAESMGGINQTSLTNAYKALYIGSGRALTVAAVIASGEYYTSELSKQIEGVIADQRKSRERLIEQQSLEKSSLTTETAQLEIQIENLKKELAEKEEKLATLDASFEGPIADIDQKIAVGTSALEQVLNSLRNAIAIFRNNPNI